jgi:hypothetical protein
MTTTTSDALKALDEIEGMLISANEYWNGSQTDGAMSDALCFIETKVAQALSLLPSLLAFVDRLTAELGKAEEELSTWQSVFPDIAPASVLPDRSKLEAELLAMAEENARLREAFSGPSAWLDSWAQHVGNCKGGYVCTCGLTLARTEAAAALKEPGQ